MKRQLYPAVLERGPKQTFGAWFPDFPGCVAGGKSQEQIGTQLQQQWNIAPPQNCAGCHR